MVDESDAAPLTDAEATALLADSRALLARIEASGRGIYYQPAADDRPFIEGVMRVCNAWAGDEGELALRLLCHQAGLSPSEWGLIRGMLEQFTLNLSGVAERRIARMRAMLEGQS